MNTLNFLEAVNSLDEDVLKETLGEAKTAKTKANTKVSRFRKWSVRAACFLIPCLAAILLFSHSGNTSQNGATPNNETDETREFAVYPTGTPQKPYLYYQGKLYAWSWCNIAQEDLPYGAELVGTVQSDVEDRLPTEELQAVHIQVGTAVLASNEDQADTLYLYCPKEKWTISSYYTVFYPCYNPEYEITKDSDGRILNIAFVDPEGKDKIMPYQGAVLHWGGRMWEFWHPFLIEKELKEGYVEAGEVLVQLPEMIADGQVHEEQVLPEKDGEASYVFSPGAKIYVLEKEKDAPTHLYVQKAPGQYIYLVPDGSGTVFIPDEPFDPSQYK